MDIKEKDKKYLWHPFTQMLDWLNEDIVVIERGCGEYLYDTDGNKYIDGVSSLWTNVFGHGRKEIDDAVKKQLELIAHSTFLGLSNIPATELAEKLVEITPFGLNKVFYADSGSAAAEIAVKVAYQYHRQKKAPEIKRKKFVHLDHSYHGDTLGSVSVGGIKLFHNIYSSLIFETISIPSPYCYRCPFGQAKMKCSFECVETARNVIENNAGDIAAVIVEPMMQGAAGMINQPVEYLKMLREVTKENGILLIFDEVATGFGRTGKMFAAEHCGISPDIMVLGKGLTGGYLPMSAALFTDEIFEAFLGKPDDFKTFYHGHTYTGNQLAASAALAAIDIFEKDNVIEGIQPKIEYISGRLAGFYSLEHVGDIRQIGFMTGIELVSNRERKAGYDINDRISHKVILAARKRGVIIRPLGDVIVIMPPLSIGEKALEELLNVIFLSIKEVTES